MKHPFSLAFLVITGISLGSGGAIVAHLRDGAPPPLRRSQSRDCVAERPVRPALAAQPARIFADDLERLYHDGQRDEADARIASLDARERGFDVACFDALPPSVEARATLHRATPRPGYTYGGREEMELTVLCDMPLDRPLVVTFPPGSYGVGTEKLRGVHHGREWRHERAVAQDLAFLSASVIVVEAGQAFGSSAVPIACANFSGESPMPEEVFPLARFERGSPVDRLMCQICAGKPTDDRVAQLAVWVARNDIGPADLVRDGRPLLTFGRNLPVGVYNGDDAAALLRSSGFEVEKARFFQQCPPPSTPATAPSSAPAPRREELPLAMATS